MAFSTSMARILIPGLLVLLSSVQMLQVQTSNIQIIQNQAAMIFPTPITFKLNVAADSPIVLVSLRYGTTGKFCNSAVSHQNMKFNSSPSLELAWNWHLNREGLYLPPGVKVWWQWLIHTADEQSLLTPSETLTIQDPDHNWQVIEQNNIHLEWFEGDAIFGQALLDIAVQSQRRLASETGLSVTEQTRVLVYPDVDAIQSATLHLPEWTGGVAYPEYSTVLAAVAPDQIDWAELVIPHEIAHLIIAARSFNCQGATLPLWMVEGFSKFAESPLDETQRAALQKSLQTSSLPELSALANRFPYEAGQAADAYQVSLAAVNFLLKTGGIQHFSGLLDQIQRGEDFDRALADIYGYQTETLDQAWRAALVDGEPSATLAAIPEKHPSPNVSQPQADSEDMSKAVTKPEIPLLPSFGWQITSRTLILGLLVVTTGLILGWWGSRLVKK